MRVTSWLRGDALARPPQPYAVVIAAVVADLATIFGFHGGAADALRGLETASGGWLRPSLVFGLGSLAFLAGVVFGVGRVRPHDLGIDRRDLVRWALVVAIGWCALQLALVIASAVVPGIEPAAPTPGAISLLIAQLVVTGPIEEVIYRGLLLPRLAASWGTAAGVLGSTTVFVAMHIPSLVTDHATAADIPFKLFLWFAMGLVMALIYLRTRSVLVCAALHSLLNAPTPFLAAT